MSEGFKPKSNYLLPTFKPVQIILVTYLHLYLLMLQKIICYTDAQYSRKNKKHALRVVTSLALLGPRLQTRQYHAFSQRIAS